MASLRMSLQEKISNTVRFLWGEMTPEELKKFWILSAIFFLLIGTYWFVRVMKDPVFSNLVGYKYQPFAKLLSLFVVVGAVLFYNKLIDLFKKNVLFYLLCGFFGIGFLVLGYALAHPPVCEIGADSVVGGLFSCLPGKALGWFIYCFIESFGSIMPALFLAIVASTMTTESAKKGYGMIYCFAQLGLILGTWFVAQFVGSLGFGILFAMGGAFLCLLPFLMKRYVSICSELEVGKVVPVEEKSKTGIFEGLRLLVNNPYIAGLLVVTTVYEIIGTIVEFQMGMCATEVYPVAADGGAGFAWFKAWNGMSVGFLSLSFALVGTSFLMRRCGLKFCLVSYPMLIGSIIAILFGLYLAGASTYVLMWAFFGAVVVFKGLNYTLNAPAKEVMYIPTSKDVKFKAKSWIDGFGGRTAKGTGAVMTGSLGGNFSLLMIFGTIASLGIVVFWIFVAAYVGNKFNELQRDNKIIE
jgi:ATP:ADP antiporter, AAA family